MPDLTGSYKFSRVVTPEEKLGLSTVGMYKGQFRGDRNFFKLGGPGARGVTGKSFYLDYNNFYRGIATLMQACRMKNAKGAYYAGYAEMEDLLWFVAKRAAALAPYLPNYVNKDGIETPNPDEAVDGHIPRHGSAKHLYQSIVIAVSPDTNKGNIGYITIDPNCVWGPKQHEEPFIHEHKNPISGQPGQMKFIEQAMYEAASDPDGSFRTIAAGYMEDIAAYLKTHHRTENLSLSYNKGQLHGLRWSGKL